MKQNQRRFVIIISVILSSLIGLFSPLTFASNQIESAQKKSTSLRLTTSQIVNTNFFEQLTTQRIPTQSTGDGPIPELAGDQFKFSFYLTNDSQSADWVLLPFGSVIEQVEYLITTPQFYAHTVKGLNHIEPFSLQFDYGQGFNLAVGETAKIELVVSSGYFLAPLKLVLLSESDYHSRVSIETLLLLLCCGVCVALVLINLSIYLGSHQAVFLYYALQVFCLLLAFANIFALPLGFGWPVNRGFFAAPFIAASFFHLLFCKHFLAFKQLAPRLYKFAYVVAVFNLLALLPAYLDVTLGMFLASLSTTFSIAIVGLLTGLIGLKNNIVYARYFVVAVLLVVLPGIASQLSQFEILPVNRVNLYLCMFFTCTVAAIFLSFALTVRARCIQLENETFKQNLTAKIEDKTHRLKATSEALRQANAAKSRFLAQMSHEIRTPLNAIVGFLQQIDLSNVAPKQREIFNKLGFSARLLERVVQDILDYSRNETGNVKLENIRFDLKRLIEHSVALSSSQIGPKNIKISMHISPQTPEIIVSDPIRVQQVLLNLIGNAIKFTEQGSICVSVEPLPSDKQQNRLKFSVSDTGKGIALENQANLFAPFIQADNSITRKFGGSGLGLAISKQLVELMKGQIWVKSAPDQGSTFYFTLPYERDKQSLAKQQTDPTEMFFKPNSADKPKFCYQSVLLVDDNHLNREVTLGLLADCQLLIDIADDAYQAIEQAKQKDYDLILMDIYMPGMDGIQATQAIKKIERYSDVPVIAMTALESMEEIDKCLSAGMQGYLGKPIDARLLYQTLSQWLLGNRLPSIQEDADIWVQLSKIFNDFEIAQVKQRLQSNTHIYYELLDTFYNDNLSIAEELTNLAQQAQWELLKIKIHSLKSNAAYIGARELEQYARELEFAVTQVGFDVNKLTQLNQLLGKVLLSTKRVMACLKQYDKSIDAYGETSEFLHGLSVLLKRADAKVQKQIPKIRRLGYDYSQRQWASDVISAIEELEYETAAELIAAAPQELMRH